MILGWSFGVEANAIECRDAVEEVGACQAEVRRNEDEDGWEVWAETDARTWLESFACGFAYARKDGAIRGSQKKDRGLVVSC